MEKAGHILWEISKTLNFGVFFFCCCCYIIVLDFTAIAVWAVGGCRMGTAQKKLSAGNGAAMNSAGHSMGILTDPSFALRW